jgi:hypothetical protein
MSTALQPIDIADSSDLLDLAEEVQRTGVGRLLKRGEQAIAVLTPVALKRTAPPRPRQPRATDAAHDPILNIVGIGSSDEPTDVAHHKREYLAEAYAPERQ